MRTLLVVATVLSLAACAKKESGSSTSKGSAVSPPAVEKTVAQPPPPPPATGSAAPTPAPTDEDAKAEVAALVVHDVGSKALGSQKIEASCVNVVVIPAQGDWTVAAARLNGCGDKTARSILWLYKRGKGAKWNEDYVGQPPKCWKGVPADLIDAVKIATKIPPC